MMTCTLLAFVLFAQPVVEDLAKSALPPKGSCVVCSSAGDDHGLEKVVAGVRYKGAEYYFCNAKEVPRFKADPEAFLPPVLPRPMPKFRLADLGGKMWDAEAMKGRAILIDFWATWCKPCKEIVPILKQVRAEFAPRGFEVLSVSIDEKRADLDKYLAKNPFENPVLHDTGATWQAWKVNSIPALFLVRDGQIVRQWSGKPKAADLRKAIEGALPKG
ncbi:MAG TPA: redoxin domain-containing protein [Fimbriimonadaceae bacterium]|nr:redoxin domain-containing protein [Fimbriimonadaceae bacterium]HRJ95180.1 redoxin domain-containing protein [Fimbriimonadaceae bacterium]